MKARYLVPAALLAALVALFAVGLTRDPSKIPSPLIGKAAPAFALPTLDGATFSSEQLKGRPVLVNFWASWCAGCLDEHAMLLELSRTGVPIVGMNYKDEPGAAKEWLARHGNPFAIIARDEAGTVAIDWGVYGVPETFVLDAQGVIRFKQIGAVTREAWEKEIAPLLALPAKTGPAS